MLHRRLDGRPTWRDTGVGCPSSSRGVLLSQLHTVRVRVARVFCVTHMCPHQTVARALFVVLRLCLAHDLLRLLCLLQGFLASDRKSNNSCWLEHGHAWNQDSQYEYWVSHNGRAPVLGHSPREASGRLHGRVGLYDVRLPENPVSRRLVGSSWLRVADERNLNLTRVLDSVTPGLGVDAGQIQVGRTCCRPEDRVRWRSGFWLWSQALASFGLFSKLKSAVTWVMKRGYAAAWVTDPYRCSFLHVHLRR